jgi:hypothetical protein
MSKGRIGALGRFPTSVSTRFSGHQHIQALNQARPDTESENSVKASRTEFRATVKWHLQDRSLPSKERH